MHLGGCEPLAVWGGGSRGGHKGNTPRLGTVINAGINMDTWAINVDFDPDSTDNQGEGGPEAKVP